MRLPEVAVQEEKKGARPARAGAPSLGGAAPVRSVASWIMRWRRWGVQAAPAQHRVTIPLTVGRQSAPRPVRDLMQHFGDMFAAMYDQPRSAPPWALLG